jgi:modulator of FtsH protease
MTMETSKGSLKGDEQKKFILKVYKIFIYSLLCSALSSYISVQLNIPFSWWWVLLEFSIFLICIFSEKNLFLLYLWTCGSGFNSGPILNNILNAGNENFIWKALLITSFIFVILSAYVFYSKKDFSHWEGILCSSLIILISGTILLLIFRYEIAIVFNLSIGLLLFCAYILFDTSNIILKYKTGMEVMAALDLHLNFIGIFKRLLRIFEKNGEYLPDTDLDIDSPDLD